jgi:hypothetical protein
MRLPRAAVTVGVGCFAGSRRFTSVAFDAAAELRHIEDLRSAEARSKS